MPKTIQREYTIRASVVFYDGDSKTCAFTNSGDAVDWVERQIYKYGPIIVASDIFQDGK